MNRYGRLGHIALTAFLVGMILSATAFAVIDDEPRGVRMSPLTHNPDVSGDTEQHVDIASIPSRVSIAQGDRVPVGTYDGAFAGYVDRTQLYPSDRANLLAGCKTPLLVSDEGGRIVGFFFRDYGFVDVDTARAPDFSIRALRIRRAGTSDLPTTCIKTPAEESHELEVWGGGATQG